MKIYKGDYYIQYQKRRSSFGLFEGKNGGDAHPYQASADYVLSSQGKNLLQQLRSWLLDPSHTCNILLSSTINHICLYIYIYIVLICFIIFLCTKQRLFMHATF